MTVTVTSDGERSEHEATEVLRPQAGYSEDRDQERIINTIAWCSRRVQ